MERDELDARDTQDSKDLKKRLREGSTPCYNLLALSAAQWDLSDDDDPSLFPPRAKKKRSKVSTKEHEKELEKSNTFPNQNVKKDTKDSHQPTQKLETRGRKPVGDRPRWWIQSFLLVLALKQAGRPLSRRVLIPRALDLEKKIAKQRGLPLIFGGRTPKNTASAILTENREKLFEQVLVPGSNIIHFKLAFEPGNFDKAVELYYEWTRQLIVKDWPFFFGPRREVQEVLPIDKGIIENPSLLPGNDATSSSSSHGRHLASVLALVETDPLGTAIKKETNIETCANLPIENKDQPSSPVTIEELYDDWEITIPQSLEEVVQVRDSTIPGAGRGLFAVRNIPGHTYLGFYFGVPMTEDEFDSLKEHVGLASQYSHRYKRTILDATDENGQPYWNHPDIFCPFHFMNENIHSTNVAFVEGYTVNQVLCLTIRDIKMGEELFVNYGTEIDRQEWSDSKMDNKDSE